jgi:DUF1680 family protein
MYWRATPSNTAMSAWTFTYLLTIPAIGLAALSMAAKGAGIINQAELFPLGDVRITDGPLLAAQETDHQYLLALDPDRLLAGFREEAGLVAKAPKYPGWESRGVAGHSLGHYLSALSMMWQATGDQRLRDRVHYIVAELAECQAKQGDGYVSAIPKGRQTFSEIAQGRINVENPFTLNGAWVPWYTQHKVLAGLIDAYTLCDEPAARDVATKLAAWCDRIVGKLSDEQMQTMLRVEHGGMADALAELAAITGEQRYLALARRFRHAAVFEPAAAGHDQLDGLHANTQIPKFIGYDRIYQLTGERAYGDAARNFWTFVAQDRSFSLGGHGTREHFFPVNRFGRAVLDPAGPETCNTYNMLKLTECLFAEHPDPALADFYERALYNHILPSEHPGKPGELVYYTTMRPGGFRTYSHPFDDFWCCVGTGMENHAKYGRFIYARAGSKLLVNLFIPSQLTWDGLTVRQQTSFPAEPRTRISFSLPKPRAFAVGVRYPSWVEPGALKLSVSGAPMPVSARPGEFATVQREWKDGDMLSIELPMSVRTEPLPHSDAYVSVFAGPVLLAAALGNDRMKSQDLLAQFARASNMTALADVPVITSPADQVAAHVQPAPGEPLHFHMRGITEPRAEVSLMPFYLLHDQRYAVYWPIMSPEKYQERRESFQREQRREQELAARVVDEVGIGEQQSESDHHLQGQRTRTGGADDHRWRDAYDGGWFSYELKTLPDQPMTLSCRYWGSDGGARRFELQIDGKPIATQVLTEQRPGEFFDVEYPVPIEQTRGKSTITVRFQGADGAIAGGVFGLRLLKPPSQ